MLYGPTPFVSNIVSNGQTAYHQFTTSTLTSSSTANQYGDWTQVFSGLPDDAYMIRVLTGANTTGGQSRRSYIDIGYGPDTNNITTVIPYLNASYSGGYNFGYIKHILPLYIPKNIPIWARMQHNYANVSFGINITAHCGEYLPFQPKITKYTPLGSFNTSSTVGVPLPAVTTGGSNCPWTIIDTTNRDFCGLLMSGFYSTDTSLDNNTYWGDIGIGPSGNIQIAGNNCLTWTSNTTEQALSVSFATFMSIKSGTQIWARYSMANNRTGNYGFTTIVYGLEKL